MAKSTGRRDALARVLGYAGRGRGYLLLSLLLNAAAVIATLYVPVVTGDVIDLLIGAGKVDFSAIAPKLALIATLAGGTALAQWLSGLCVNRLAYRVARDMRVDAFTRIQSLPLAYLDSHPAGDIISRVISDVDQLTDGLLMGFNQLFSGVLTIAVTLYFLFSLNAAIAVTVVVLTPLSLVAAFFIARRTYAMFSKQATTRGEQTALIEELVTNQKLVRAFGAEGETQRRFDELNGRFRDASFRAVFYSSLTNPSTRFINAVSYAAVGAIGALACIGGGFTVGRLAAALSYAGQYAKPFNEISGVVTELQGALACAERVLELISEPTEAPDVQPSVELASVDGRVSLEDVSFSYVPERRLIEHFSLNVASAQHVAIVGPTGCGKTTLINLLMRFYDVQAGRITVSGHGIADVTRRSLRAAYGMVLQDTWLKTGTVRENIALGREDATDDEIIAAAKATHAHGFIKRLPDGYNTVLSEDGGSLSQGQKQLLSIARVMLTLPPMLILDEATSSIDTRTERHIQRAFDKLMTGRTSFIVAHRLSTVENADIILVMNEGHIVEQGTHDELLKRDGFYKRLYMSQFAQ